MTQDEKDAAIEEIENSARLTFKKLEPKPGDIITVTVPESMSGQEAMGLAEVIGTVVPEGVQALLLQEGVTMDVMTEEEMNTVGWTRIRTH